MVLPESPNPQKNPLFPEADPIYSLAEASKIMGMSAWTIRRRAKEGKLKILRLSMRRVGITGSEIRRYTDDCEVV